MKYLVIGRHSTLGQANTHMVIEAPDVEAARAKAEESGLTVERVDPFQSISTVSPAVEQHTPTGPKGIRHQPLWGVLIGGALCGLGRAVVHLVLWSRFETLNAGFEKEGW
jgi:hypothetical protein